MPHAHLSPRGGRGETSHVYSHRRESTLPGLGLRDEGQQKLLYTFALGQLPDAVGKLRPGGLQSLPNFMRASKRGLAAMLGGDPVVSIRAGHRGQP